MSDPSETPTDLAPPPAANGPAPHAAQPAGFLENPLIWLAETTGFALGSPVDEAVLADQARRWTSRSIVIAALVLLVFNAASIQTWASTLSPNWGSQTISALSGAWSSRLAAAGLDQPRAVVRGGYEAAKQAQWRDLLRRLRVRREEKR